MISSRATSLFLVFSVLVNAVSCVHRIPVMPVESCAYQGFDFASDQCARVDTQAQRCRVRAARRSWTIKDDYNSGVTTKNTVLAVSYLVLIVPGIVMYLVFHNEQLNVEADSDQALDGARRCRGVKP